MQQPFTSEYSQVKREHKKLEKSVTGAGTPPLLLSPELCGGCGADVFRHCILNQLPN